MQESRATGSAPRDKLIKNVIPYSKAYDKLFQKGIPYPKAHDKIKLGMRLTVMKTVHPSAEYDPGWSTWRVDFGNSVFKFVRYSTNLIEDGADPEIISMEYYFTDKEARKYVTDQALQAFGSDAVKSAMLGEELEWSDIGGTRVKIDPARYVLSKARDERDTPKIPP